MQCWRVTTTTVASVVGEFHPTVHAPKAAREFLREQLARLGVEDLSDDAGLLLSEVATNVVRHAHTDFVVQVEWVSPELRVEVRDGSSIIPAIKALADEHGGLGLRLVDALADEWGVERRRDGKSVWFTLSRPGA